MDLSLIFYVCIYLVIPIDASNNFMECSRYSIVSKEECVIKQSFFSNKRYIFYDVNPHEGFNLRRDVYVRVATFIKLLIEQDKQYQWTLVLPPWGFLHHWQKQSIVTQTQLPWSTFFNLRSLKEYIPVLEMHEFIDEYPKIDDKTIIDCVYYLQNDKKMFETGIFKDKNEMIKCSETYTPYIRVNENKFIGPFWGYLNISSHNVQCITFHGTILNLKKNLKPNLYRTFMFDHMEIPLHYTYGSAEYWKARRSMRYNSRLYKIAAVFRFQCLNSSEDNYRIINYKKEKISNDRRDAIGGPYLAVHFRRKDFVFGRENSMINVTDAAFQIKKKLKTLSLNTVFVATDAEENEYTQLAAELKNYNVVRFLQSQSIKSELNDGSIAIIDQIICSQARYFIGTRESTFTFRIQEDREIFGFPVNSTFNFFCVDDRKCVSENVWKIIWE